MQTIKLILSIAAGALIALILFDAYQKAQVYLAFKTFSEVLQERRPQKARRSAPQPQLRPRTADETAPAEVVRRCVIDGVVTIDNTGKLCPDGSEIITRR